MGKRIGFNAKCHKCKLAYNAQNMIKRYETYKCLGCASKGQVPPSGFIGLHGILIRSLGFEIDDKYKIEKHRDGILIRKIK